MLFTQKCGKVFSKRVKPDIFGLDEHVVAGGFLAPNCANSDVNPVGGLLASALVALIFHEGLQQHGFKAISVFPVPRHLTGSLGEDL